MPSNYRNRSSKSPVVKKAPKAVKEKTEGYERDFKHPSGRYWEAMVRNVIAHYNGICHLCDHPSAKQADHVIPYAESRDDSIGNLRPAHGVAGKQNNRCPVCGLACNNIRGSLSVKAAREKIARRQGKAAVVAPAKDLGREW